MKLSNQAMGALMLALQKCLMEQSDITEILKEFDFAVTGEAQDELVILNPPTIKVDEQEQQSKFEW
jgi:hypothetical protein